MRENVVFPRRVREFAITHMLVLLSLVCSLGGSTPVSAQVASQRRAGPQVQFPLGHTLSGHGGEVTAIAFSPDGRWLATGSKDETVKLWEVASGQEARTLVGHGTGVYFVMGNVLQIGGVDAVAFSPDGQWLASGGWDNKIKLWEVATGQEVRTLAGHTDAVRAVAFSPDGRWLASGSLLDGTVKLWEVATGSNVRTFAGLTGAVAFSPDGNLLASWSYDGTVRVWEAATGRNVHTLRPPHVVARATDVAFSPDGRWVASANEFAGEGVTIWEVTTGRRVGTLTGHDLAGVKSVAFSPDGRWLATAGDDNTVKLWKITTGP